MPDFDPADMLGVVTPATLLVAACAGFVLAVFLWTSYHRVLFHETFGLWVIGLTFMAVMTSARWADGAGHWEAWIGAAILWSVYVGVAEVAVFAWRHLVHRRGAERSRV